MRKKIDPIHVAEVFEALTRLPGVQSVVKIIDAKTAVKATYRFKPNNRNTREEIVITFGKPDYAERHRIERGKKQHVENEHLFKLKLKRLYPSKKEKK